MALNITNRRPDAKVAQEHGVATLAELILCVPHQRPPHLATRSHAGEPVAADGDKYIAGDHDFNSVAPITEWIELLGIEHLAAGQHQRFAIEALIEKTLCAPAD